MKLKLCLPLLVLGCLTGCIEFARQSMSYRYDSRADTLFIFQDYQGIFGAATDSALQSEEKLQLASVMKGERTFFFNNWIFEYNRATTEELLSRPKGEISRIPEFEAAARTLAELALANIKVENLGFYKNQDGQLCGAQQVTIHNASKLVAALNRLMPHLLREQAGEEGKSQEEKELLAKFATSGEAMLQLNGNQIEIRFPLSKTDYLDFESSPHARSLRASDGSIGYKDNIATVKVGSPTAKTVTVTLPFSENTYVPNALAEASRHGIKTSFDPQAVGAAFLNGVSQKAK